MRVLDGYEKSKLDKYGKDVYKYQIDMRTQSEIDRERENVIDRMRMNE